VKHPDAPADEVCNDNADNDGDGLKDCDDDECQSTSACYAPKPADPSACNAANCSGTCVDGVCYPGQPSCQGFCGKQSAGGCWCDEFCARDPAGCCADYAQLCK
jgi:hypothetical protein